LHASTRRGHLHIQTQQVQTYPKGLPVQLTSPSREGVPPAPPRHMSMTHQSSRSTALQASRSARVPPPALQLKISRAHTNFHCRHTMSQIRVQILMAIPPLLSRSPKQARSNYHRRSRQLTLVRRPTTKAMTRCFTPIEPPTTHITNITTTSGVRRLSARLIMASAAGPRTVVLMVAAQDTPPPIIPPSQDRA
jgi:hypothetical protein